MFPGWMRMAVLTAASSQIWIDSQQRWYHPLEGILEISGGSFCFQDDWGILLAVDGAGMLEVSQGRRQSAQLRH